MTAAKEHNKPIRTREAYHSGEVVQNSQMMLNIDKKSRLYSVEIWQTASQPDAARVSFSKSSVMK